MRRVLQQLWAVGICLTFSSATLAAIKEYHLNIDEQIIDLNGKPTKKITVNGQFPAPLLEFEEGDEAVIHVHNALKDRDTSLHWHGLLLPGLMDGVPGFNGFRGIKPHADFEYRFKIRQSGTYWYHAHSQGQEQDGLYGALVIYPKNKKPIVSYEQVDRDYVVMLSDFHHSSSDQIMKNLKKSSEYYQNQRETIKDVWHQLQKQGFKATWQDRKMWNQMRMLKTDLSDVTGYTFLVNGKTPEQNWTGMFKPNEKVRLRFINASAMSFFDVRIPQLPMTVVSADGQPVKPVQIDEFRIGAAETYDVIVEPQQAHYQIQAESMDRSSFALASLQNELLPAPPQIQVPTARPRSILTMEDMGHHSMDAESDSSSMQHEMPNDDHAMSHNMMQHDVMSHDMQPSPQHKSSQHSPEGWANASTPMGLKALQYTDLKSLFPQSDLRQPDREIVIHLGGNMERYIWTMNGKKFSEASPLTLKYGERVRLKFVNDSMMAHPMHLHGMFVQLENGQAMESLPNKHTLIVPPGKTVTALLTADEVGEWAIHCHLLYHMTAGMMNKLVVAHTEAPMPSTLKTNENSTQEVKGEHHAHH